MRPRRTAVVITVLTGSLISALSLGLMLLVSRQLRVGLFELDALQQKLNESRQQLKVNLAELEQNRIALASAEKDRRTAQLKPRRWRGSLRKPSSGPVGCVKNSHHCRPNVRPWKLNAIGSVKTSQLVTPIFDAPKQNSRPSAIASALERLN